MLEASFMFSFALKSKRRNINRFKVAIYVNIKDIFSSFIFELFIFMDKFFKFFSN